MNLVGNERDVVGRKHHVDVPNGALIRFQVGNCVVKKDAMLGPTVAWLNLGSADDLAAVAPAGMD